MPERRLETTERRDGRRCRAGRHGLGTAVVGLGLLGLGVTLTLDNMGLVDAGRILPWWPLLLVLLGSSHALQGRWFAGTIWVLVGGALLVGNLDLADFDLLDLWPLLLVLVGGNLLWGVIRGRRVTEAETADTFSAMAVLGGVTRKITAREFAGGSATAFMGGCEIDLTSCETAGPPAEIHAFAMWGGVEIKVPEDWEVRVEGTALLGAFEDTTQRVTDTGEHKVLVVRGIAIMGGVEVKS
jgi:predicted membrane protein